MNSCYHSRQGKRQSVKLMIDPIGSQKKRARDANIIIGSVDSPEYAKNTVEKGWKQTRLQVRIVGQRMVAGFCIPGFTKALTPTPKYSVVGTSASASAIRGLLAPTSAALAVAAAVASTSRRDDWAGAVCGELFVLYALPPMAETRRRKLEHFMVQNQTTRLSIVLIKSS